MINFFKNLYYTFFPQQYKIISERGIEIFKVRFYPFKNKFMFTIIDNAGNEIISMKEFNTIDEFKEFVSKGKYYEN